MNGTLACRETHAELLAAFEQYCQRFPQYCSYIAAMEPGIMQRAWRKNGHTYLQRGDAVFFFRRGDATVIGLERPYEGSSRIDEQLRALQTASFNIGIFSVKNHWVADA